VIIYAQQSSNSGFTIYELRDISKLLSELQYRRSETLYYQETISSYELSLIDYDSQVQLYEQKQKNYEKIIESLTPNWWDNVKPYLIAGLSAIIGFFLGGL